MTDKQRPVNENWFHVGRVRLHLLEIAFFVPKRLSGDIIIRHFVSNITGVIANAPQLANSPQIAGCGR